MTDPFASGLPTLCTERLCLRHPTEADLPAFLRVFGSREDLRFWSHGPLTDEATARTYLGAIHDGVRDRTLFQWAIADGETDAMMGTCTLTAWDRDNRHAEIGFILARERWGRGLATEAVRRVLTFGFDAMGLHRVEADVHPENGASLRLLETLGFQREGYLRERWRTFGEWEDSVVLGLLEGAFEQGHGARPPRSSA
ncbi:MAG: GNAT family N-acetyltransferase [Bacteroidota bacterium]